MASPFFGITSTAEVLWPNVIIFLNLSVPDFGKDELLVCVNLRLSGVLYGNGFRESTGQVPGIGHHFACLATR